MNIYKSAAEDASHIPEFPNFAHLNANHQEKIEKWVQANQLYSDYNFISLWTWDHQNEIKISILNDNLVIKFQGYQDNEEYFYSFWGSNRVDETAKTLLNFPNEIAKPVLRLIPEFVIEKLEKPDEFVIHEDRDNHDYVLAIKNMVDLSGSHNDKKRNALRQFIRDNQHHLSVKELDLQSKSDIDNIREVLKTWTEQVGAKVSFNVNELRAINKMLDEHHNISASNLQIIGIHLGDKLKAFSITEALQGDFAMWHYKKSDRSINGLGVALDHFTAKNLHDRGLTHLNYEQDLGIQGLRQSKMSSYPVYFLKKYTLELKV